MSTLVVENLNGPSSGSNANKVIIPSGHTLDASAGTITPSANQIVKTVFVEETGDLSTSSGSYSNVIGTNYTPLFDDSILYVSGVVSGISFEGGSGNSYQGSTWRYIVTPSGGTAVDDYINFYQFHFPSGSYWGGMVPFSFKFTVSSTVSHSIYVQAFARSSQTNYLRNRNGEVSTLTVQEIKQ